MLRLLIFTTLASGLRSVSSEAAVAKAPSAVMSLKVMDFEVFGRVQGVFFRKFTKQEADKLGLRGWCMNTPHDTVVGHIQGPPDKVENMVQWLRSTGSPSSKIDKTDFKNAKDIDKYTFDNFTIRKD